MQRFEKLTNILPRPLVKWVRDRYLWSMDIRDKFRGHGQDLAPPRSLHYIGTGDFRTIGKTFLGHFIDTCSLRPDEAVLDIGCGTGRMAIPLLDYLDSSGSYIGFDISRRAISWCRKNIGEKNPSFQFVFADIQNGDYNPRGRIKPEQYRFPCRKQGIDFAFATSVFTHMRLPEVKQYLKELARCLRPSGRAMLSFFIMDETNRRLVSDGKALLAFRPWEKHCYTTDPRTPERAIALSEEVIPKLLCDAGLLLDRPILYGSWSGRKSMLDAQDIIVVRPASETSPGLTRTGESLA